MLRGSLRRGVVAPTVAAVVVGVAGMSSAGVATGQTRVSVELRSGRVDGHRVLGRSIAGVTAALGRPTWRQAGGMLYRIGYGDRTNFRTMVLFRKRGGVY